MSNAASWQEANSRFLSLSLHWLRTRLERAAEHESPKPAHENRVAAAGDSGDPDTLLKQLAELEKKMDPPPALVLLAHQFGLSRFERDVLLLCVAMELDTRVSRLCALAQNNAGTCFPTFALALIVFDDAAWEVVSPERPLRFWRAIEVCTSPGQSLTTSPLRADERIVNFVKGLNHLDDRLLSSLTPLGSCDAAEISGSQQEAVEQIVSHWRNGSGHVLPLIQLLGTDSASKYLVATAAAERVGRKVYRLSPELLPAQHAEMEVLSRLWQRESLLLPLALYVDAQEMDAGSETMSQVALRRFLAQCEGLVFLGTREFWPRIDRPSSAVEVRKPTPAEQERAWSLALGEVADGQPPKLAAQFNLNLSTLQKIVHTAVESAANGSDLSPVLWECCRNSVRPRLDQLAHHLEVKAGWDDIVLPPEETNLLRQIAAQVGARAKVYGEWGFARKMNRGMGISALFAGDSGTGKTMAAEVIARELHLNLYRIDLSTVVSKYIGETEKNLRRLFDAAEDGGAILFFDEADALFGKRSEVKDSHDRYANIEINYLLQRLETYSGLAILATNMKSALDQSFLRRLRFVVNFPFPGVTERRRIWQRVFPPDTPLGSLDYDRLSRLNLTGGTIHNAALNAAFLAAHAGTPVTMPLVLAAARTEMLKLDRPVNETDFICQAGPEAVA
ncbi:MAG TPA: ATP-binding protein [Candidatus Angelobacter sp.]